MTNYVDFALFIHTPETEHLSKEIQANPFSSQITPLAFELLIQNPEKTLDGVNHLVVSGSIDTIKKILELAIKFNFSIGILPMSNQKDLIRCYALPRKIDEAMDLALQRSSKVMDLILCNGQIMLFKTTIGRLPLMDSPADIGLNLLIKALKRFKSLELIRFDFTPADGKRIRTMACGSMIIQHHEGTLASRLISHDSSLSDGMISMIVSAPRSIIEYLTFLFQAITSVSDHKKIPDATGYIKSPRITIESERKLDVYIDGERSTHTPLYCETIKQAVHINIGDLLYEKKPGSHPVKSIANTANLPLGKEVTRVKTKTIPFFSYASEERFRDLFTALREDAKINSAYLVLMLLSTLLATVGLYLDSSSVIIGAMLLAPLMAPIISLAMGLLRQDQQLSKDSLLKIITGVSIALITSAFISIIYPHDPTTSEMTGRLHPTLLDLSVAIVAGIAGAYTKSFKEILQSLAGVAIAVALVPPLAVAGIGIGRWDLHFFGEAFLLFGTNLIGIILAATLTFRLLGYSPVIQGKRSIALVAVFLLLISVPLSLSFNRIVEKKIYEKSWQEERFLINEKYLIVKKAEMQDLTNKKVLGVEVLVREPLTRNDLTKFKRKIQTHFARELIIRINVIYIP